MKHADLNEGHTQRRSGQHQPGRWATVGPRVMIGGGGLGLGAWEVTGYPRTMVFSTMLALVKSVAVTSMNTLRVRPLTILRRQGREEGSEEGTEGETEGETEEWAHGNKQ
jgi:hypothetical protein